MVSLFFLVSLTVSLIVGTLSIIISLLFYKAFQTMLITRTKRVTIAHSTQRVEEFLVEKRDSFGGVARQWWGAMAVGLVGTWGAVAIGGVGCCAGGGDWVILDVQPLGYDPNPGAFLDGTKHFVVTSQSSTCECSSKCQWMDRVFWYRDRSVVIKQSETNTMLLENVVRQLRGE